MNAPQLKGIKACVFDAYGTLFDVHSAIGSYADELGDKSMSVSALWRDKQLQYTWLRSLMGTYVDFWQVTAEALTYALDAHGITDNALKDKLLQAYLSLDAYPEVSATLEKLQASGFKTAILSNGAVPMLNSAVINADIDKHLNTTLSVDVLGVYKPDPRVYQLAVDTLGVEKHEICFLSSNGWDVAGSAHFGFQTVWINRFGQNAESLPGTPKGSIKTLDQLPALLS